ncbi:MAG TPA: cytochrome c biogenesis heme-transporting ATPase CcmA [Burkholderiales bacterium]
MLDAVDLECERGGRKLFRRLSFSLGAGEALRIAGANGSGKTSLLRILCGLAAPAAGEVRWKGESVRALREDYSAQLVYLGHAPAVKDELRASENLSIACRLAGNARGRDEVSAALRTLAVPEAAPVKTLSQGQRRRAALARLLLSQSVPLWLLDEPLAALDAQAARLLEGLIAEHTGRGGMVVYTTHQDTHIAGRVISLDA